MADFLDGQRALPPPLDDWATSYDGRGTGAVFWDALPEPYGGSLQREPRAIYLSLNPGAADLAFQSRTGVFADEIRRVGSYSAWVDTGPYVRDPWERAHGKNRHGATRLTFVRRWLDDPAVEHRETLSFELYPWHSTRVIGAMRPDPGIVREFVFAPILEFANPPVFAFGAPWFPILDTLAASLDLELIARLGRNGDPYPTRVPNRAVVIYRTQTGGLLLAEKHSGSAVPPSADETAVLREHIAELVR